MKVVLVIAHSEYRICKQLAGHNFCACLRFERLLAMRFPSSHGSRPVAWLPVRAPFLSSLKKPERSQTQHKKERICASEMKQHGPPQEKSRGYEIQTSIQRSCFKILMRGLFPIPGQTKLPSITSRRHPLLDDGDVTQRQRWC